MKSPLPWLLLILFAGFSNSSTAARYWVATVASNWNNTANWSNVSGGAGGFSVPGIADDVIFDNNGIGNCTIDVVISIKSITANTLYTGTISQGANALSTVSTASFSGGTFTGGSANITIGGNFTLAGTAFTSTSAVLELDNLAIAFTGGSFSHNNGTVRLNGGSGQTISGTSPVFYTLEFVGKGNTYTLSSAGNIVVMNSLNTSGSLFYNLATGTIDVKGDINSNNTATGCGGDATININGTGTQNFNGSTVAGAGALPQLTINKTSGTLSLTNFPAVSNNFTYTAGTINAGTSTFCFTHGNTGTYNITGTLSLNNIDFTVNTSLLTITIPAATTLTTTGDLIIAGAGNLLVNTGTINVNGNLTLTNTGNGGGGSATINIVGTGAESIDGTAVTVNQSRLPQLNINKAIGTLSLLGNISFSANVTYTAGVINPGTSTCYIVNNLTITGSFSVYNLCVSPAGNTTLTIASGSTITATNLLDLENGSNYITINTGTIAVQGDIIDNNSSTIGGGTGTLLINGTGTQNLTSTGVIDQGRLPAVTINKLLGTLVLPSLITVKGDWNYLSGTVDAITNNSTVVFENTLNITGSPTLNNVIFDGSNNYTFTTAAGTTLTVSGTMSMIGTSNITLSTGTINLYGNLILSNTGVGGGGSSVIAFVSGANQSIISALAVNQNCLPSISINKPGWTLTFPALITVKGNWTYLAGILDVTTNSSTVVFASPLGSGAFGITGSHTLNNVTFQGNNNNTATINTGTILTVTGTLSTTGASNVFINTPILGATAINAQGNISINNTSVTGGGTGLILINGTGAQAFTSTAAAGQGLMPYITIQKTAGTLTLTGIISESRDWTYVSGTVDASSNSSTVVFGGNSLSINSTGMSFYHVIITSNTSTLSNNLSLNGNLTINGTGVLVPGANTINLAGNWTDRGTAGFTEATSTVNFNGTALQTITSPGGENFTNLAVNNTGTGIQLVNSATVATNLTMTKGNIDLNGNALTLGLSVANSGTLGYTAGSMLGTGSFVRWFKAVTIADGAVTGLFPMGTAMDSRSFYISAPSANPTTGGTIAVAYANATTNTNAPGYMDGASTIMVRKDLNWAVTTGNGLAGGTYDLEVQGTGFGIIGNISDLRLTLAGSVVGSPGTNAGTTAAPQINRTGLTLANLSNTFYVGSVNAVNTPLPITLVSFTASVVGGNVKLDWETAAEINNDYFTIQRSKDGAKWESIQQVAGSGSSNAVSTYTTYDPTPYLGKSYYRLIQTDRDGKQAYSSVSSVNIANEFSNITVSPNPATTTILITFPVTGKYEVSLLNSAGQPMSNPVLLTGNHLGLNVSNIKAGIYFIHISNENSTETRKLFIRK